jgi:hypothetical protein
LETEQSLFPLRSDLDVSGPNAYIVVSRSTTRLGLCISRTVVRIPLTPNEDTSNCNPVLHKAAAMLIFSLVVAGALLLDSIWLQIVMQAIHFDAITVKSFAPTFGIWPRPIQDVSGFRNDLE